MLYDSSYVRFPGVKFEHMRVEWWVPGLRGKGAVEWVLSVS